MNEINIEKLNKVYFIGIKGSGMIAFVEIFHKMGKEVTGSDTSEKFFTDSTLKTLGIKYHEQFNEKNIENAQPIDLVVYSTAYHENKNPELKFALDKGIPMLSYPELVELFMKTKYSIAVCGTHGKTTTSAMLALAMKAAGADPTAVIGSKIKQLDSNVMVGESEYFILEADEYQNKLAHYNPNAVILTNLDYDHPDFFKSFEQYLEVFKQFIRKIPPYGFLVVWGESVRTLEVAKEARCKIIFYGNFRTQQAIPKPNALQVENLNEQMMDDIREEFKRAGKSDVEFFSAPAKYELRLKVPGIHNQVNATAVLAVCEQFGLDQGIVLEALMEYQGAARRFEELGSFNGAKIIDDYAHHPQEIRATLAAARDKFPQKNIICVFHPHTYSRTKALLGEFSESFEDADQVIVLDIYASARESKGDVHAKDLVARMEKIKKRVEYIPSLDEAYNHLEKTLGSDDVLITMGAGNVFEISHRLVEYEQ